MHNLLQMSDASRSVFETLTKRIAFILAERCVPRDGDLFLIRLERYFEDLHLPLLQLYGDRADSRQQFDALFDQMLDAYVARPEPLRLLDLERQCTPNWFQQTNMVGYVCYTEEFAGNLAGVQQQIDYLRELGITYLHLMPILKPRPDISDGGYAVMDYRTINPALGDMADLRSLTDKLRTYGQYRCQKKSMNREGAL